MNDSYFNRNHNNNDLPKEIDPKEQPYENDPYGHDPKGLDIRAVSATDCTGLIPALPASDSELESYAQVYHYPADIFQD
ncbi:MAG: hypothetical protein ACI39W_04760 [Brotaphodocola sp.]